MKKNRRITALFISCLLFFTIPLRAAVADGIPEDAAVLTAQDESWATDSSYGGELTEDVVEFDRTTQAVDSEDSAQADSDEGSDSQEQQEIVEEAAPGETPGETDSTEGAYETVSGDTEQGEGTDNPPEVERDTGAEQDTSGTCGEELYWKYSEGILSIIGSGEMYDYSYAEEAVPGWSVFSNLVEEIHIEKGVTMLDLDAFTGFTALKAICFNGSDDAWASVMLTGEEVLPEEDIFNSTEIRFAEQEGTAGETVGTEDGIEDGIEGPEQDPSDEQPEGDEAQDPVEGQPEEAEAQDPAEGQPEEDEVQDPADAQPEEGEAQDPAEGQPAEDIPEEAAAEEQPAAEAPGEGAGIEASIAGTEEQAVADAEDQEDPEEAIADGQSEEPAADEKKEEPSSEEKKGEPAAEEPAVADGEQPSFGAKETVPDVLLEQGDEETAADDAAGASQGTPLAITEQPEDVEALTGETVSVHVGANREDAAYEWQFSTNGTTWKKCTSAGSNTDTFSFLMKDTLNGRMYRCAVTAGGTTLISDAAAISLKQEQQAGTLSITAQPEDAEASVGQTVSFHVGANRTDASYQWQFSTNGTTWKICTSAGSNTDTFSFLMKDTLDGRKYRCAVTADGTTIISGEATVRLPQQQGDLTITQQPQDVEAAVGETVSLHVGANMADASFQWQFSTNGTTWKVCSSAGSNTDTFSFLMKDTLDGRKYRCAVTGGGKTILSDEATVRLPQQGGLSITQQPQDVEAAAGETVSLNVGANMADASFQWQFSTNGTTWKACTSAGSNTDTFSFLMKDTLDGRKYRCAVAGGGKTLTSAVATVSLSPQQGPLAISVQPEDVEASAGESVSLHVGANMADASYQWQFSTNGTTWKNCTSAGCNTDTFSFLMKETLDGRKYRCAVSAGGRRVISKIATITIASTQTIIQEQPKSVFAVENDFVTLTVKANASDYRWQYYNSSWVDINYTGHDTDTLQFRFTADLVAEALSWEEQMPGLWRCVVSDYQGNTEISDTVYVLPAPYFEVQPEDQSGNIGDTVVFNASVNGQYGSWYWEYSDNGGLSWQHLSTAKGSEDSLSVFYGIDNRNCLYRASVIDNFGNIYNSRTACIRASDDIFIYSQPVDQTADVGETISFFLIARYVDTYQWQISDDNGVSWENIENSGADTDTLTLIVEEKQYNSLFRCVVSDNQKSIVSNTVRILQPEFAESNEADFNWSDADSNIFINGIHVDETVILTGFTDTSQWSWNTQDMVVVDDDGVTVTSPEGESNDVLQIIEISQVKSGDNIHYIFKLKGNRVGRALLQGDNGDTTVSYLIEVYGDTPVIVTQPEDQSGEVGDTIQFSVDAIGAISYKWTHNGFSDGDDNTKSAYSAIITSGSYHKDYYSGSKYQCKITGCGGAVVKTNNVYVYRPSECWIEGDDITVEIGDEYKIICHSYSCSNCRLEYSYDGEIWYQAASCGNSLQSSGSYTYTYERTMTNYQTTHQYNLMYRWVGTGLDGEEVISNIIRVLEPQPVAILKQPEDQYARVGETAHFEIEAENAVSCQWQVSYDSGKQWNYIDFPNLNNPSETPGSPVFDVSAANYNYQYLWRCIVTGVSGYQLESQAVTIKYPNGYFIENPTDQIVSAGEYATFSVQAFEADSYQWQSRPLGSTWSNISNATTDTYTVKVTTTMLADMEYRCIIIDKDGKTTASLPARLIEKLKLTGQPKDQKLHVGDTATFTVEASGVRQWQWYVSKDGGDSWEKAGGIGENTSQLSFTIEPIHYEWIWRCDMIGDGQRIYSNNVRLYPITVITRQPHNMEASLGQTVGFDLAAENASNYQWQVSTDSGKSWSRASGSSTGSYYSYTIVSDKDYEKRWQCVLSDTSGNELVSDKVCVVEPSVRPIIHKQPHSVYSEADTTTTFSVTATGVEKYQWQKSYDGGSTWEEVSGNEAKTDKLSVIVTETMWDTVQWRCLLTGSGGTTVATNAVYVYEPVVITDEPNDVKGRVGQLVTFDVHANGQVQYQWQQSNDNGISWTECSGSYENGRALDISVEKEHFTKCCWRCLVSGPLGDQIFSKIVHVSRAEVAITDVSLNMQTIKIKPGKTQQLAASIEPLDATDQRLQWYSDNVNIATVNDNGLVTAVSKGSTQIRVCAGGRVSCCNITVADAFSIELTETNSEIWTNDGINTSILVKLEGASMPCKINARFITKTGKPYIDSGTKTVNESEWTWAYEPISKPGIYNIVVSATDAENRTVTVRSGNITVKRKPVYRALMIYQNDWNTKVKKLKKAPFQAWFKNDAYYMRDLLLQNTYEGGAKYTVKLSKNKKKSAIKAKIKSTFKGVKDGDVSLIHIGCHGNSKGGGDLFVPGASNATDFYNRMKTPGNIYRITPKELKKWIKDFIPKGKVVIILHSCGSGAMVHPYINESKNAEYMDTVSDAFISEFREADRAERSLDRTGELKNSRYFVLTSSAKKEVGAGWADRGCWLAYWLSSAAGYIRSDIAPTVLPARGIPLADTDGDGSVTISEAYSYVREKSSDYGEKYKWSNGKPAITNPKAYWSDSQFKLFQYSN